MNLRSVPHLLIALCVVFVGVLPRSSVCAEKQSYYDQLDANERDSMQGKRSAKSLDYLSVRNSNSNSNSNSDKGSDSDENYAVDKHVMMNMEKAELVKRLERLERIFNATHFNVELDDVSLLEVLYHSVTSSVMMAVPKTDRSCR